MIDRSTLAAVIALCLAAPAAGQASRSDYGLSSGAVVQRGDNYLLYTRTTGTYRPADRVSDRNPADRRECLTSKKNGHTFCLTRSQWEAVAAGRLALPD